MFIIRRLILYLNPIVLIIGLEFSREKKDWWWLPLLISGLLLLVTIWDFSKRKINKRYFDFLITPFVLFLSNVALLMFIESLWLYRLILVIGAVFLYLYLDQLLNYFYFSRRYQPYTLENFSFYINVLSVFFISATLFGGLIFLHFNIFILAFISLVFYFLLTYQVFWVNKISWSKSYLFSFIIPLVLAELLIAISYLPTSFYVNGFLVAVFFYLMIGLSRLFLQENLLKKNILSHIIISLLAIIVILLTAQWI